jgi:hypothetical protein
MDNFRKLTIIRLASLNNSFSSLVEESLSKIPSFSGLNILVPNGTAYISDKPIKADNSVDIMFQFRGGTTSNYKKAGFQGVMIFADVPKDFKVFTASYVNNIIQLVLEKLSSINGKPVQLGKLGLSAFSGGAQALSNILRQKSSLIKSPSFIFVADGIHGSEDLWTNIAKDAEEGKTKFILTHTAIKPDTFKSTTEVADKILQNRNLSRQPVTSWNKGLKPESVAEKGNFKVIQYHKEQKPYQVNGKVNVPGTAGYQHIQAAQDMSTYLSEF